MTAVRNRSSIPLGAAISTFLRSFAIQGSWNYRTMIGQGFAFALLPVLQHVHRGDPAALERAVERHAHHFNAHPYMAELALGAVARMEADGASPDAIERFKKGVRGPLGSLGDRLIWAGALPTAALLGLLTLAAGVPIWIPPVIFVVAYNAVHLTLRIWAFRAGLEQGAAVVKRIGSAHLPRFADAFASGGTFLIGALLGVVATRVVTQGGQAGWVFPALVLGLGGVILGEKLGNDVWRYASLITAALVFGVLGFGLFS